MNEMRAVEFVHTCENKQVAIIQFDRFLGRITSKVPLSKEDAASAYDEAIERFGIANDG